MLRAPDICNYWNGEQYVRFEGGMYEPGSEEEKQALLKCHGVTEVGQATAPLPLLPRGRKRRNA